MFLHSYYSGLHLCFCKFTSLCNEVVYAPSEPILTTFLFATFCEIGSAAYDFRFRFADLV